MKKLLLLLFLVPCILQAQAVLPRPIVSTPSFYLASVTNTTQTIYSGTALRLDDADSVNVWLETIDSVSVTNVKLINVTPNITPIDTLQLIGSTFTNNTAANKATYATVPINGKQLHVIPYVTAALTGAQTTNNSRVRVWIVGRKTR